MKGTRRRGQVSPLVLKMARRQIVDRMPGFIRIERSTGGEGTMAEDSLDLSFENDTVYEGRARLALETSGLVEDADELTVKVSGQVIVPYAIEDQIVQPMAEDLITVIAHVDQLFVGAVLRITGVSRAGHLPLQRELTVDGFAPGDTWADMTVHPVIETEMP